MTEVTSPDGVNIELTAPYTSIQDAGVTVVVVAAGLSVLSALTLLGILGVFLWRRRSAPSEHFFVRTHAAAFFTSLIVADIIQGTGSMMNLKWVENRGISLGIFCSTQGALKNAGNLAVSLWTLMLAIHTFCVLFLRAKPTDAVLYVTLLGVWILVGVLVVVGPAGIQKVDKGPYYGISGAWCWIADPYPLARILLEYAWMFTSAFVSFILYTMTFLRLRGNIVIEAGKMRFRRVDSADAWQFEATRNSVDIQMTAVARGMLGFPILFTVLIVPIAICRFMAWSGKDAPFEATIFADSAFSLMGVFHLILFATTRALFPREHISLFMPRFKMSDEVKEYGVQPYVVQDFASAHGFNDHYARTDAEKGMTAESVPPRTGASMNYRRDADLPPLPPIPPPSPSRMRRQKSMGATTVASMYSQEEDEHRLSRDLAWDEVDLGRRETRLDSVSEESPPNDMRFTLSAYQYESEESPPPMPAGAGIDIGVRSDFSDDEDEKSLVTRRPHKI